MTRNQFTPGPWTFRAYPETYENPFHLIGADDHSILEGGLVREDDEENAANAWMMITAPEMHAALCDAPIMSKYHGQRGFEYEQFAADYEAWRKSARLAIAKAEGRTDQ